jgi:hypothetical protein
MLVNGVAGREVMYAGEFGWKPSQSLNFEQFAFGYQDELATGRAYGNATFNANLLAVSAYATVAAPGGIAGYVLRNAGIAGLETGFEGLITSALGGEGFNAEAAFAKNSGVNLATGGIGKGKTLLSGAGKFALRQGVEISAETAYDVQIRGQDLQSSLVMNTLSSVGGEAAGATLGALARSRAGQAIGDTLRREVSDFLPSGQQVKRFLRDEAGSFDPSLGKANQLDRIAKQADNAVAPNSAANGVGEAVAVPQRAYQSGARMADSQLLRINTNTKNAVNITEWRRTISPSSIRSERIKFVGEDAVKVDAGTWRSLDGTRQFRTVPNDYLGRHGIGQPAVPNTPHVHFEFLAPPNPGGTNLRVLKNVHVPLGN